MADPGADEVVHAGRVGDDDPPGLPDGEPDVAPDVAPEAEPDGEVDAFGAGAVVFESQVGAGLT